MSSMQTVTRRYACRMCCCATLIRTTGACAAPCLSMRGSAIKLELIWCGEGRTSAVRIYLFAVFHPQFNSYWNYLEWTISRILSNWLRKRLCKIAVRLIPLYSFIFLLQRSLAKATWCTKNVEALVPNLAITWWMWNANKIALTAAIVLTVCTGIQIQRDAYPKLSAPVTEMEFLTLMGVRDWENAKNGKLSEWN